MSIPRSYPDKNAERVCTHKWAFATARTISFGAGRLENTIPCFSASETITLSKYNRHAVHHALILRIVLPSQHTPLTLPRMIISMVFVQCRLYGTTISGSSWWTAPHPLQRSRRITSVRTVPSLSMNLRFRLPMTSSFPPHTVHTLTSLLRT